MPTIDILESGRIDDRDSAFPQAVQLPDGDILCSFSVGGGAHATGGSDWARSRDGGETWTLEGNLAPGTGGHKQRPQAQSGSRRQDDLRLWIPSPPKAGRGIRRDPERSNLPPIHRQRSHLVRPSRYSDAGT